MKKKPNLSLREVRILAMLADGCSYEETRNYFGISSANLHTTCSHIRKKTGIKETRDANECKLYFLRFSHDFPQHVADAMDPRPRNVKDLTDQQLQVLRLIAMGRSYGQIAEFMGILSQSVQNLATRACKAAGITHQGWNRTRFIKEWFKTNDPQGPLSHPRQPLTVDPMADPAF